MLVENSLENISLLQASPKPGMLVNIPKLVHLIIPKPDPSVKTQRVSFGTSGHRGSSFKSHSMNGIYLLLHRRFAYTVSSRV